MTRTWTSWIGYVVAAWSAAFAAFGVWWALGGAGFPFGTGDPELMAEPDVAFKVSLLGRATPEVAGPIIAVVGLIAAAVAVAMARGQAGRWTRRLAPPCAWVLAVGLAVVIQDYRTLVVVAYTPILAIAELLGVWPDGSGWGDLFLAPRLYLLVCLLAGIGWALTAVAYRRRITGACGSCGRAAPLERSFVDRWGRPAVWAAVAAPLFYCATRWAWALGFSLGIDSDFYQEGKEEGLWIAGAALASFGVVGSVLTLGLIQRWGEVFPRWMVGLRGRRVPPMLAVVPAVIVSALVTSASFMYLRIVLIDGLTAATWALNLPEVFFSVWGAALFVAALAYHRRRRGACESCGAGPGVAAPSGAPASPPRARAGRLRASWTTAHTPVDGVSPWARIAAYSIPFVVIPSGLWRVAMFLFGDGHEIGMGQVPNWLPGWVYVVLLSIVSELLAFTAVGLVAAWGEVFPRWVPGVAGRRVPTLAAVIPAGLGAIALTTLFTVIGTVLNISGVKLGGDPLPMNYPGNSGGWSAFIFYAAYAPLVLWGPLLGIVTVAYWRRRSHTHPGLDAT